MSDSVLGNRYLCLQVLRQGPTAVGDGSSLKCYPVTLASPTGQVAVSHASHANIQSVCAAEDFVLLLTWDGCVIDSRALPGMQQAQQRQCALEVSPMWRPPGLGMAVLQVAAGGCGQGSGKDGGGHALALAADGSLFGWGANTWGQLGLGTNSDWVAAASEILNPAEAQALGGGVASISCGSAHSGLLLHSGDVALAGCNTMGACGMSEDQDRIPVFCLAGLSDSRSACRLSCGGSNTAVVTTGGRLLVCGDNEFGQCGPNSGRAAACWEFTDVGPDARWHGMPRVNQGAQGGGGQAAAPVVDVCCGSGSIYALTGSGEVFAWGQGGQGELGLGGSCKNTASPSKLPWARDIVSLAASAGGRFAAAVDAQGRLLTFGAGKAGQLGHGDTNKRAVGRTVKALQHAAVRSVACGADFMVATACWRGPSGGSRASGAGQRGQQGGKAEGRGKGPATPRLQQQQQEQLVSLTSLAVGEGGSVEGEEPASPLSPAFRYVDVDPTPSPSATPRSRRRSGLLAALLADPGQPSSLPSVSDTSDTPRSTSSSLYPSTPTSISASFPSTPLEADPLSPSGASGGPSSDGRRPRRQSGPSEDDTAGSFQDSYGSASSARASGSPSSNSKHHRQGKQWVAPDPEERVQRRRKWMAEPPGGAGECSGGEDEGGSDRRFRYLLRRQLKVFASAPQQRELAFPPSLSPSDRYKIHVVAEAWGLMHQSYGEGAERHIIVWKPSRTRRSLKASMVLGASEGYPPGIGTPTHGQSGDRAGTAGHGAPSAGLGTSGPGLGP
ncbi:hypothetical protein N2152v2_008914 [Parachlorella kessleri]